MSRRKQSRPVRHQDDGTQVPTDAAGKLMMNNIEIKRNSLKLLLIAIN